MIFYNTRTHKRNITKYRVWQPAMAVKCAQKRIICTHTRACAHTSLSLSLSLPPTHTLSLSLCHSLPLSLSLSLSPSVCVLVFFTHTRTQRARDIVKRICSLRPAAEHNIVLLLYRLGVQCIHIIII